MNVVFPKKEKYWSGEWVEGDKQPCFYLLSHSKQLYLGFNEKTPCITTACLLSTSPTRL